MQKRISYELALFRLALTLLFCAIVLVPLTKAQIATELPDKTIDAATRSAAIEDILRTIKENYIFPDLAERIDAGLRRRKANKEYDSITSAKAFAETLTKHLYEVCKDKHVYVRLSDNSDPMGLPRDMGREGNFGIPKVEILSGNVGYLQINSFPPPDMTRKTLAAAMNFLANTDALIIDLRNHRGGAVPMVALTVSYFVPEKPVQLITVSSPHSNLKRESWTLENVDGPRYLNKPVYLLTSNRTFSGGEEFAYDMQALKRATLIGETTGGGANNVRRFPIQNIFSLGVSIAQVKNTITGSNWEGVGVKPDVEVTSEKALQTAHDAALKYLAASKPKDRVATNTQPSQTTAPPPKEAEFPNTAAGRTVRAFIEALNSGDKEKMKQFHFERSDKSDEAKKEIEEYVEKDYGFYEQSGGVKLSRVISSEEGEIEILVQTKNGGQELSLQISVSITPPHAIESIRIRPFAPRNDAPESIKPNRVLSPQELPREVETYLDKLAQEDKFSGAALIAQNGKPLFQKAYGQRDKSRSAANNLMTKFNLGSMNKMFTAVAIAQLVQRGKLSFDDKVGTLLPDYPNKDVREKVSVHHLLTHTSGLGSFWNKKFDEKRATIRTVADYISLFAEDPLLFEPGARFNYSNAGFIVLGAIIEKVSGQNYYDYVRENIFKPAGMKDTDYYEQSKATPNLAMGYTKNKKGGEQANERIENISSRPNRGGPAGGGYSTAGDLLKFHQALQSGKLLSSEYLKIVTSAKGKDPKNGYAYGFGNRIVNGKHFFGHNGGAPGIAAELMMFPETGITIVMLSNYDPQDLMPVAQAVLQMVTRTEFQTASANK